MARSRSSTYELLLLDRGGVTAGLDASFLGKNAAARRKERRREWARAPGYITRPSLLSISNDGVG